jgi:hypothetical protein
MPAHNCGSETHNYYQESRQIWRIARLQPEADTPKQSLMDAQLSGDKK